MPLTVFAECANTLSLLYTATHGKSGRRELNFSLTWGAQALGGECHGTNIFCHDHESLCTGVKECLRIPDPQIL